MVNNLKNGVTTGAVAEVSNSEWSNTTIFRQFLIDHFLKYVPVGRNKYNILR